MREEMDRPTIQCMHCGQWFYTLEEVRRHQTLNEMLMSQPQIFDWTLEVNYINGEWE